MASKGEEYKDWSKVIWAKVVTPRHAFIMWIFMYHRVLIKCKMARFTNQITDLRCEWCNEAAEDTDNMFFQCRWAKEF